MRSRIVAALTEGLAGNNYKRTYSSAVTTGTHYMNSVAWPTVLGEKEQKWYAQESRKKTRRAYAKA